ncbi:restriction endonuclease subunit S [Staphylococcus hominis]|uniref:restriction endonuclease subunit S n=1 Tax=Staphylococcus hominis TaxID=1290 RepID=UPI00069FC630|nr:restriction endonuclease subunit S [Staphylococcus hominis]
MTEQANTPVLRFKSFNDEWSLSTIGALGDFYYGKSAPKWSITEDVGIPCIRYGELYTKFNNVVNEIYSYTSIPKEKLRFSKGGEILIPRVGEDPLDFAKCVYLPQKDIAIGEMISVYNTKENPLFLTYYFNTKMKYEFAKRVEGASVSNLYYSYLEDIKLKIPDIREQEKLGKFFSKLDRQIELEEEKLELLEQQKRGYMQKIFSQQLKFKDENGQYYIIWEAEKLGELTNITTGSLDANAMVPNGKYKFFTCARETYEIDTYAFDTEALLISGNGANVGYIHYYQGKFNAYQRTYVLNNFKANITYLKYYLEKYLLRRIYSEKRDGNTPYITRSTLYDMEIMIPSLEEQEKIGNFFNKIDNLIELQVDKIEVLKQRKKGLLQKMFV